MKVQTMLKRAAAVTSGAFVLSASTGITIAEDGTTGGETTSAVAETTVIDTTSESTETVSEILAENEEEKQNIPVDWEKADISDYDSSLTLISYEIATPEMAKVGEPVDPYAGLSEEERKALEEAVVKKKNALRKATPTLSKNAAISRSKIPTAVELVTSGATVGDIPSSQPDPTLEAKPGQFAFVTYGWGHGVGMSQNGAGAPKSVASNTANSLL